VAGSLCSVISIGAVKVTVRFVAEQQNGLTTAHPQPCCMEDGICHMICYQCNSITGSSHQMSLFPTMASILYHDSGRKTYPQAATSAAAFVRVEVPIDAEHHKVVILGGVAAETWGITHKQIHKQGLTVLSCKKQEQACLPCMLHAKNRGVQLVVSSLLYVGWLTLMLGSTSPPP
jgi:hypothetical protein